MQLKFLTLFTALVTIAVAAPPPDVGANPGAPNPGTPPKARAAVAVPPTAGTPHIGTPPPPNARDAVPAPPNAGAPPNTGVPPPTARSENGGCVFVPANQGCGADRVSCGHNDHGDQVKCCQNVCS